MQFIQIQQVAIVNVIAVCQLHVSVVRTNFCKLFYAILCLFVRRKREHGCRYVSNFTMALATSQPYLKETSILFWGSIVAFCKSFVCGIRNAAYNVLHVKSRHGYFGVLSNLLFTQNFPCYQRSYRTSKCMY